LVSTRIFIELVEDALKGPSYAAQLAGLSFTLSSSTESLYLKVYGYNERLLTLLTMVLNIMCHLKIDEERFTVMVEKVM
jgi:insulysin